MVPGLTAIIALVYAPPAPPPPAELLPVAPPPAPPPPQHSTVTEVTPAGQNHVLAPAVVNGAVDWPTRIELGNKLKKMQDKTIRTLHFLRLSW